MASREVESWVMVRVLADIYNELDVESGGEAVTATLRAANLAIRQLLENGLDALEANRAMVAIEREIPPGSSHDIDLYDWHDVDTGVGYGLDALGQEAIFEEIVLFVIRHASGAGRLEIMSSVPTTRSVPWCPRMTVARGNALREGGVVAIYQPDEDALDIQDRVSQRIRLGAVGGFVYYDIFVLGRSED